MTRATLVLLLAGLAIAATVRLSPSQSLTAGRTPPNASTRPLDAFSLEAAGGGAFTRPAAANPPSLSPVLTSVVVGGSGNQTDEAGPTDSPVSGSASSATLDLRDFALATPALRPLASDCRLPCYGIARVGPASWYRDWRFGPTALYAAIPGYVDGSVTSVVVCTFPDGRANCATFPVTDSCQCYRHERRERVIDLSPAAFAQFASLWQGVVMVQVTVLR